MAEVNPPWALEQLATHHANVSREMLNAIHGGAEGVLATSGLGTLAIVQRGAGANMSVDAGAGICLIFGDESNLQGLYGCLNDATKNLVIGAADPTNPRRDLIVAKVQDQFYSGATNAWSLAVVAGTPAGSPADPAVPNNAVTLARVAVAAGATSIVNANITDLRPYAGLPNLTGNSARRPGVLYGPYSQEPAFKSLVAGGVHFYEQDTRKEYVHDGTAWNAPVGTVCQVVSVTKTDSFTTASTSMVDLTGATLSITPRAATNKVLVRGSVYVSQSGANLVQINLLRAGSAIAQSTSGGFAATGHASLTGTTDDRTVAFEFLDSPATTSATIYKLQVCSNAGTTYVNLRGDSAVGGITSLTVMEIAA